jgi:FG-GAP-like repeat/FG-GAP repeat
VFDYTVAAGQDTPDLQVSGLTLNGATIANPGTVSFEPAITYATASNPSSVTTADVNGDGKPDLIVANIGDGGEGSVSVLLNDGSGGFSAATNYAAGLPSLSVTTADVNGDGKPDIIVANQGSNDVSVLLNDSSGGFGAPTFYAAGEDPLSITTADVNGDGRPDIIVANQNGDVSVLLNNGSGGYGAPAFYATGTVPLSVTTADVNEDGKPDIIVTNGTGVSVLLNNGSGGFGAPTSYSAQTSYLPGEPIWLTTADVNGDGIPDIITANQSDSVSVLLGNGHGGFGAPSPSARGSGRNRSLWRM